jgi:hypothetical protein
MSQNSSTSALDSSLNGPHDQVQAKLSRPNDVTIEKLQVVRQDVQDAIPTERKHMTLQNPSGAIYKDKTCAYSEPSFMQRNAMAPSLVAWV